MNSCQQICDLLPAVRPFHVEPQGMLALTLRDDVGNVHPVAIYRPDYWRRMLRLLVGIGVEGDLRALNYEFSLVGLVEERTWTHCAAGFHMLPVILEGGDESSIGPQADARSQQLEPVLPPIL